MTDNLIEQLVTRSETKGMKTIKIFLILLTVLSFVISPVLTIIFLLIDFFVFGRMKVEYEYTFFMGDLDIAKIVNKSTRKKMLAVNLHDVILVAPKGSPELHSYKGVKAVNCSTLTPGNKVYELIAPKGEDKIRILFEPSEELVKEMQRIEPRKVIF